MTEPAPAYASRAGAKLHHALHTFNIDPTGWTVADFGCSVGGFTDCWLKHNAARVYAIDTAYGQLDYRLRTNPRVTVLERTNALHAEPPADPNRPTGAPPVDAASIDLSWTTHDKSLPTAANWLRGSNTPTPTNGVAVLLLKPHYEATGGPFRDEFKHAVVDGALDAQTTQRVIDRTLDSIPALGFTVIADTPSPIVGAKSKRARNRGTPNLEHLVHLQLIPADTTGSSQPIG